MPKFKVKVVRYVEEVAELELRAKNPFEARKRVFVNYFIGKLRIQWKRGEDFTGFDIIAVVDENGEIV
jgi:hypothetical protein